MMNGVVRINTRIQRSVDVMEIAIRPETGLQLMVSHFTVVVDQPFVVSDLNWAINRATPNVHPDSNPRIYVCDGYYNQGRGYVGGHDDLHGIPDYIFVSERRSVRKHHVKMFAYAYIAGLRSQFWLYHKDLFIYDPDTDTYVPEAPEAREQRLRWS